MSDHINPRHLLRDVLKMLERARCPECGRAFDEEAARETDCHRMVPLNCAWCSTRLRLLGQYKDWIRQDQQIRNTPAAREYFRRVQQDQLRRSREYVSHE